MKDNEIIKALECCASSSQVSACDGCPYNRESLICEMLKSRDALDLINRQKAEIERLEKQIKELLISEVCELHIPMEIAFRVRKGHPVFKEIKSEVVKEFAEKLKEKKCSYSETEHTFDFDGVTVEDIDDLVKEMTEEHYETK